MGDQEHGTAGIPITISRVSIVEKIPFSANIYEVATMFQFKHRFAPSASSPKHALMCNMVEFVFFPL
jgi:hypothetical protein